MPEAACRPVPACLGPRLWDSLETIALIGGTPAGGLHRLAASPEDGRARDVVVEAAMAAGCTKRLDAVGNVFLRRPGKLAGAGAVLFGSHVDSQPAAGRYDGTYGVMAGLEVLQALHDAGAVLSRPVELVIWTNEEGARFAPAMMGSAVFTGRLPLEEALSTRDADGVALGDALAAIGYAGTDAVRPGEVAAYLEAHIEQGPLLERRGLAIGVVTGVQAQSWLEVLLEGEQGHAGTFPMETRRDAMVAAADLVGRVRRIGLERPGLGRATVGRLTVEPNTPNVIPGRVSLTIELRHPDGGELDRMLAEARAAVRAVSRQYGVAQSTQLTLASGPVVFDERVVAVVEGAAAGCRLSSMRMVSGAGHDAVPLSDVAPTGMVFIPCRDGVSHAESESIDMAGALAGARVLLGAVLALADR